MLFAPVFEIGVVGDALPDVGVAQEGAGGEVKRNHATRTEAARLGDFAGEVVHEACFGGEDDVAVVEYLVAGGAESVAVEGSADGASVSEDDGSGAVPRFHDAGVIAEEGARFGGEDFVFFPGRGHHHHDGVARVASAKRDGLEGVVEGGGVAHAGLDERLEVVEAFAPDAVRGGVFAGAHEVAVASDGVDFAVVRHHAEGMGEFPGGKGVGREALVENRKGGLVEGRLEVGVKLGDLRGREEAFVNDGARGEGADVEAGEVLRVGFVFDGVLREEEFPLEFVVCNGFVDTGNEGLHDEGLGFEGFASEAGGVDGDVAPAEEGEAFGVYGINDEFAGVDFGVGVAARDEEHAYAEVRVTLEGGDAFAGKVVIEEWIRDLREQSGAVTGHGVGVNGSAVRKRLECRDGAVDDVVGAFAVELGNEADSTGVVLLVALVEGGGDDVGHGRIRIGMWCEGHVGQVRDIGEKVVGGERLRKVEGGSWRELAGNGDWRREAGGVEQEVCAHKKAGSSYFLRGRPIGCKSSWCRSGLVREAGWLWRVLFF